MTSFDPSADIGVRQCCDCQRRTCRTQLDDLDEVTFGITAQNRAEGRIFNALRQKRAAELDRLSDRLETRVKVDLGRAKGKVTIEFASLDDLQRIVDVIEQAPGS